VAHVECSGLDLAATFTLSKSCRLLFYDADLDGLRPATKPPALLLGNHPDPVDPKSLPGYQPPNASGGVVMAQPIYGAPGLDRVGIPSSKMRRMSLSGGT
jgi:hypothetical protein